MARGSAAKLLRLYSSKLFLFRPTSNFPSNYLKFYLSSSYICRFSSAVDPPKSLIFRPTQLIDFPFSDNYAKLGCSVLKKQHFSSSGGNVKSNSDLGVGAGIELECNGQESEGFGNDYKELRDALKSYKQTPEEWNTLTEIFDCFSRSGWVSNQAFAVYIGTSLLPTAAQKFREFFLERCQGNVVGHLVWLGPGNEAERFLYPIFVQFCLEEFPYEIKRFKGTIEYADLTKPHTWFPFTRSMKRKIIYHCGPTNSGKTYNALQRFMEANKGIYCSPLGLLAMEVFDKVNAAGVYCSLLTGQEEKQVPFSNHVACTIEMASTEELYEVAVIDEIQMMANPQRGHAWTRAFLGLKADEVHLCGDQSVLNIVREICSQTGDELVEQHYERFKKLEVEAKTLLGDLRNVRSGDCVVAFSRREIFEVKLAIEKHTKHSCCVIYGALPLETRRIQANLFNDQDNEYDILVSTDAVGMGLNLNIKRVVFYTLSKYKGDMVVPLAASQIKQIAGRAGCRGSHYPDGLTTTLRLEDLDYLISCLEKPFDVVTKVGLFPFFEQVELFAGHNHFDEEAFPFVNKAQAMATNIADILGKSLNASWTPESRNAGKSKPQEKQEKEDGYEWLRSLLMSKEK